MASDSGDVFQRQVGREGRRRRRIKEYGGLESCVIHLQAEYIEAVAVANDIVKLLGDDAII